MKIALIVLACLLLFWETSAAAFAQFHATGDVEFANEHYRHQLALALLVSAIPTNWLLAPFLSDFYENGWNWTFRRRTK